MSVEDDIFISGICKVAKIVSGVWIMGLNDPHAGQGVLCTTLCCYNM